MEYLEVINSFNTSDIGLISIISQKSLKWQDNTSPLTPTFKSTDMADVNAHRSQNEKKKFKEIISALTKILRHKWQMMMLMLMSN